jgi:hypothetical protein
MNRTPRRTRVRLWVWVYLVIFGTDGDVAELTAASTSRSDTADEQDEVPPRRSE